MADGFRINDRRASARPGTSGIITGQSVEAAKRLGSAESQRALELGRQGSVPTDQGLARKMAVQRLKTGAISGGGGFSFATQRPRDPMFYWEQNNVPFDFDKPEDRQRLRKLCRHVYNAHSVMASAIDIYSKWPLSGMELQCKDPALERFYTDLFMDRLNYEEFLPQVNREYWTVGEAFPLGSFNETLGVWDNDELINPDDVFVEKSPFLTDPNLFIRLPETLRRILLTGQPAAQYHALIRSFPELKNFASENARMPVSGVLLKHLAFRTDPFASRGMPIMYRALRPLIQEEMLNSAQDAIADRLYTPLILAKIGASATDLGTQEPWVPTPTQIGEFEQSLDAALAADFRVLTTHFAVDMSSVFGRETMPNFDPDFERLTEKQLQAFGLSKTMLSGAGSGETYAADAMNRDLISQLLSDNQRTMKRFVRDRMLIVAEAQQHYDYEVRGGKRYPIMEEVLEVDEETGEHRIVEQPKLLVPDLHFKSMSMADEESLQGFLEGLRASGVPISMERRLVNVDIDFEEEREKVMEEQVQLAVDAQEVRKQTYQRLRDARLPIPPELERDFLPKPIGAGGGASEDPTQVDPALVARVPLLGVDGQDASALVPLPENLDTPPGEALGIPADAPGGTLDPNTPGGGVGGGGEIGGAQVIPLPRNRFPSRPEESDEMRAKMPKPAHLVGLWEAPAAGTLFEANEQGEEAKPHNRLIDGPRHVGMSKYVHLDKDTPLPDQEDEVG